MSLETPMKIRSLQKKLYQKAKEEPSCRFYLLYDKMYREDILAHAYALAKSNQGAPGVDGQSFQGIESQGMAERHPGGPSRKDVSTTGRAAGDDPEARRRRTATGNSDHTGSGGADSRQAVTGANL